MNGWDTNLTNLRDVLADVYWDRNMARAKAKEAGLNPNLITISDNPIVTWFNILDHARVRGKVAEVIDVALKDYPDNAFLTAAKANALTVVRGPDIATSCQ